MRNNDNRFNILTKYDEQNSLINENYTITDREESGNTQSDESYSGNERNRTSTRITDVSMTPSFAEDCDIKVPSTQEKTKQVVSNWNTLQMPNGQYTNSIAKKVF